MVLKTPYGVAEKLERLFEPRLDMAVEVNMIGHHDAPEEQEPRVVARHRLEREERLFAKRRKLHLTTYHMPEDHPPRRSRDCNEERCPSAVIPTLKTPVSLDYLL